MLCFSRACAGAVENECSIAGTVTVNAIARGCYV